MTREVINDFLAIVTVKASGNLWGSQVATGFYYPIFSAYSSVRLDTPFGNVFPLVVALIDRSFILMLVLIKQAVQTLARPSNTSAVAHVTVCTSHCVRPMSIWLNATNRDIHWVGRILP